MSVRSTPAPFHHRRPAPLAESERDFVEQRRAWQILATSAMDLPEPTARGSPTANLIVGRWYPLLVEEQFQGWAGRTDLLSKKRLQALTQT